MGNRSPSSTLKSVTLGRTDGTLEEINYSDQLDLNTIPNPEFEALKNALIAKAMRRFIELCPNLFARNVDHDENIIGCAFLDPDTGIITFIKLPE